MFLKEVVEMGYLLETKRVGDIRHRPRAVAQQHF
jgi:hypothetical protein